MTLILSSLGHKILLYPLSILLTLFLSFLYSFITSPPRPPSPKPQKLVKEDNEKKKKRDGGKESRQLH
jgi:hypothetical protein